MAEYQSNSHRSKELAADSSANERKVQKVVSGKAKTRENKGRKFADIFISEDAANVKSYVVMDVLVPAIKKAISDIVTDGIDMILYGTTGNSKSKSSSNRVAYRSYYSDRHSDSRDSERYNSNTRFDDDIVYSTKRDAEIVRDKIFEALDEYGLISVSDVYDMSGLSAPHTGFKYGWTNIRSADITRVKDGFIIKLPKAMPID